MAIESSHGFILWGVPRYRRSHAVIRYSLSIERPRPSPTLTSLADREMENLPVAAGAAADKENSEAAACLPTLCQTYH
jgi:hypothetical protein